MRTMLMGFRAGRHPMGNDGLMFTDYKAPWRLARQAADFARSARLDQVYILRRPLYDPLYNSMDALEYARTFGNILFDKESEQ